MSKIHSLPERAIPLNKYQGKYAQDIQKIQEQKLKKAAQMYETQFLNTMVQAMRKTVMKSDLQQESYAEKIYKDQLFDKYVQTWTQKGGIGIGDMIYNQLHEKIFPQRNISVPKGPLEINPKRVLPIEKQQESSAPIEIKSEPIEDGVSLIFKEDKNDLLSRAEVKAPWAGKVSQVYESEGRSMIELLHDEGMVSKISYLGQVSGLRKDDLIDAGQKLGLLSEGAIGLSWQIKG